MMGKYLYIALIAVALVIISPIVYGAVEPSIVIPMDSGQSPLGTKPLQIKDNLGTEVFSVNPDGTHASPNVVLLHYEQKPAFAISTVTFPFLDEIAVWEIVKTGSYNGNIITFDSAIFGQINGGELGWYASKNSTFSVTGMHWQRDDTISGSGSDVEFDDSITIRSDENFIAFGARNGAGSVSEFSGTQIIHLPSGFTIKRVL